MPANTEVVFKMSRKLAAPSKISSSTRNNISSRRGPQQELLDQPGLYADFIGMPQNVTSCKLTKWSRNKVYNLIFSTLVRNS